MSVFVNTIPEPGSKNSELKGNITYMYTEAVWTTLIYDGVCKYSLSLSLSLSLTLSLSLFWQLYCILNISMSAMKQI